MGGARRGGGGAGRGSDLRYNMTISLEDAFRGRQTEIRIPTSSTCDECSGTGAEKGSKPIACQTCHGAGKVRAQQGFFTIERTCPTCGGVGQVIENPCRGCGGSGRQRQEQTLEERRVGAEGVRKCRSRGSPVT